MAKYLVKLIKDADVVIGYEIKQKTDAKHKPRGLKDRIFVEGVDTKYPKVEISEDGTLSIIEDVNPKELKEAYETMDKEVADEAHKKIGTKNRESMLAFVDAFQLRVMLPEKYAPIGLLADVDIADFSIGDPLDTPDKIKDYYSEILFQLDIYRLGKIKDYLTIKATLGL